jgi:hypothetical protein
MTVRFQLIWILYALAALIYTVFGMVTHSGLNGYLMKLELDTFGAAEDHITALVVFFALFIPLAAITVIVEKLAPSLIWNYAPTANQKPEPLDRLNRPLQHVSWKAVLVVTAIPLVIGAVLVPMFYFSDQQDQQEKVYAVDLTSGAEDLPKEAKFVELTGVMARSYAFTLKSTLNGSVSYELFAPITGKGWTPADPVRYFVRHEFRSNGLKLSSSYAVIDWRELPNHQVPSDSDNALMAGVFSGGIAVIVFIVMAAVKFQLASVNRKKQKATIGSG